MPESRVLFHMIHCLKLMERISSNDHVDLFYFFIELLQKPPYVVTASQSILTSFQSWHFIKFKPWKDVLLSIKNFISMCFSSPILLRIIVSSSSRGKTPKKCSLSYLLIIIIKRLQKIFINLINHTKCANSKLNQNHLITKNQRSIDSFHTQPANEHGRTWKFKCNDHHHGF